MALPPITRTLAFGHTEVFGKEAECGIKLMLDRCEIERYSPERCILTKVVAVYKITVDEITDKKRFLQIPLRDGFLSEFGSS